MTSKYCGTLPYKLGTNGENIRKPIVGLGKSVKTLGPADFDVNETSMALQIRAYLKYVFHISQPKHML